jgi:prepilin-type N-terminal cleavage/methylation domain-containing protein
MPRRAMPTNRQAFTLIELLVVISIIGLLSSIAVVSMGTSREKARLASGKQYAASVDRAVGDQIVGRWDFDECSGTATNDTSGNGNNGTLVGSPAWSTNTPSGQGCSLNFNAATRYVSVPDSAMLDLADNFTVSFWVNMINTSASIFMIKGDGTLHGLAPAYGLNGNGFSLIGSNCFNQPAIAQRADVGVWHHFVGTVKSGVRTFYIDGHLAGSVTAGCNSWDNANILEIGRSGVYSANALMDEVRVYAGTLTAMQVQKLYAEESRKYQVALGKVNE